MKVALSIEVTDQQRNALAQLLDKRPTKRLATRDEARGYLDKCIAALNNTTPPVAGHRVTLPSVPSGTPEPTPPTPSDPEPVGTEPPMVLSSGDINAIQIEPTDRRYSKDTDPFARFELTKDQRKKIAAMRAAGQPDNYIRGFLGLKQPTRKK